MPPLMSADFNCCSKKNFRYSNDSTFIHKSSADIEHTN